MRVPIELARLGNCLPRFLDLVGRERWYKRIDQLDAEQNASFFQWKIVSDYHWLEMAISHQVEVLKGEGRLLPELVDPLDLAALDFAATVVEIHGKLPPRAQERLKGQLRGGLNAETGFAALYLEVDIARKLGAAGYDVRFPDLEGTATYDLEFKRGSFEGEVECKSLSADAGRRIHRKDFYRFMEALSPALEAHRGSEGQEVLLISLADRLSPDLASQAELRRVAASMLNREAPASFNGSGFRINRLSLPECLGQVDARDLRSLYERCCNKFGPSVHISGALSEIAGCLVVMRSEREDDTSKPWLTAMRKAADQLSGQRPGFIAVQFQDLEAPDLMLPSFRRRAGILSYALFGHYGAKHVNATYVCGYSAVVANEGILGSPAFSVPNPAPAFAIAPTDAAPFLTGLSDSDYAEAIGAPLPAASISRIDL